MKKITYLLILCCLIGNISYSQTYDWTGATDTGTTVTQTVSGVLATVSSSTGNVQLIDAAGYGNTIGNFVYEEFGSTSLTITFASAVNVASIFAIDADAFGGTTWVFTPTGGSNSVVNEPISAAVGKTVNLNWTDVTVITITNIGNTVEYFGIDTIILAAPNTAPVITDTSAGQTVNDNATASPFSTITTTDADGDNLSATITLDTNAKGVLSGTGLTGTGPYAIASTTPADLQAKLRALSYNPTDNRTSTSETTTFTVVINDATTTDTDTTTTVVSNAVAPTVSSVSVPSNTTYIAGQNLDFTVNFNENITVVTTGGTPQLAITIGATVRQAVFVSGSGSTALLFRYTVQNGDLDTNGIAVGALATNGGTIRDSGNANATLTLNSISSTANVLVDASAPTVTSVSIPNAVANVGDAITVTIIAGESGLSLNTGQVNGVNVTGFSDDGGGSYSATYTVSEGNTDRAAGDDIPVNFILSDTAGNNSTSFTTAISQASDAIDANTPSITSSSIPNTSTKVGDAITVTITASEGGLSLNMGQVNGVNVTGFSDDGGGSYSATYTVSEGNTDRAAGDDIPVNFILSDTAGNNSTSFTTAISQASDAIDANTPAVVSVTVPANATYIAGQNLDFTVNFNENITIVTTSGTPQVAITIGATIRKAVYVSGNGSTALLFRYTVQAGDLDFNGITIGTLATNGGTLRDIGSNNAILTLNSVGSTTSVLVDASTPTLNSSNPTDDSTGVIINQDIILTFNENINKGTGNILIKKTSDNTTIETIDVTTASVTVSTNTATINPSSDFDLNTGYYIQIDNTAFKDASNNNYTGISNTTSLNFTTQTNLTNTYLVASGNWSVTSNWSLGRLPISTDNVNVGTSTINLDIGNVTVNDLSISIGGSFNILSGQSITIEGNLNQNGTLNMLSNASNNGSLIVKGNHTGISNVDYHRYLSTNWHLIASPVANKHISDFSGNVNTSGVKYAIAPYMNNVVSASRWNYYTTGAGANNIATAGTFTAGKGYSIQKNTGGTLNFSGTLNTTDKTFPITDGGDNPNGNRWNLVGNPYTASLNASNAADATNNFLKVNIDAGNLDPSRAGLYLWNGTTYIEKSIDDPAFYIAPGQGFFVHAPNTGGTSVSFTENMQTHRTGNIFARGSTISYPEIILNITEDKNSSSTKIRYIDNKTKGLDPGSDIGTFTGTNSSFKVFSHLITDDKGVDFAIQALPNQDYENTIIPIGLNAKAGKNVVFSTENSNLPNNIEVYLEDRENNVFTNLSKKNYNITLKNDTNSIGQFYIHTTAKNPEDNNIKPELETVSIYISKNNSITIKGLQTENASLNVFSVLGTRIISTSFKSTGVHVIQLPKASAGVYIVELNSNSGKIRKKIILK